MTLNHINPEALGQRTENDQVLVGHASPSLSHDNKSSIPAQLKELDDISLENLVEYKISRFLEKLGQYYPEDLYSLIIQKVEKPLIKQILLHTGGNQVHAARVLGINRNTLRKKIKIYSL